MLCETISGITTKHLAVLTLTLVRDKAVCVYRWWKDVGDLLGGSQAAPLTVGIEA